MSGTWFEVAVEHGFAAHVVFVGDFLSRTVVVLQVGAVDGSDQRLTQVQLIDLSITKENNQ